MRDLRPDELSHVYGGDAPPGKGTDNKGHTDEKEKNGEHDTKPKAT